MSKVLVTETYLEDIADAIRNKLSNSNTYTPAQMAAAIDSISSGIGPLTPSSLVITNAPTKVSYSPGDTFDPTGMIVEAIFEVDDLTLSLEVNNYTYSTNELTVNDTGMVISYTYNNTTVTATQAISVVDITPILNNNSWAAISKAAQAGEGDLYWDIGDCKSITLNGTVGTLALNNTTLYVYILDFNHPVNKNTSSNNIIFGGFKTAQTGGTDVCLVDSYYGTTKNDGTKAFNINHWGSSSSPYCTNYGGWKACDFRYDILGATSTAPSGYGSTKTTSATGYDATQNTINSPVADTLMSCLPVDFRNVLQLQTRYVDNKGNSSNTNTNVTAVIDAISLLTEYEVFGTRTRANNYEQQHQSQMAYYSAGNAKIKYQHSSTSTSANWQEASPYYYNASGFCYVSSYGNSYYDTSQLPNGLAPIFQV